MPLYESGEDYLETIYLLSREKPFVRSVDIADALGYSKPSISRAVHILQQEGMLTMAQDGQIRLTKAGVRKAQAIYERHCLLTKFFSKVLGVNPVTAERDACKTEHILSEETFLRLKAFMETHEDAEL